MIDVLGDVYIADYIVHTSPAKIKEVENMAMPEQSLYEFLEQEEGVNEEGFKVTDEQKADWVLRKLRQVEEQRKEDIALAESEIEKIDAWLEQKKEKHDRDRDYFQGLLAAYAVERRQEDPKFKSLKLPNGRIRFKKVQPKWNYDNPKTIESLKKSGLVGLIRVKEEPDKASIKKKFEINGDKAVNPETGEILDGVTIEHNEDRFEWEVE